MRDLGLYSEEELMEELNTLGDCRITVDNIFNKVLFKKDNKLVFTYELYSNEFFKGYLVTDYR